MNKGKSGDTRLIEIQKDLEEIKNLLEQSGKRSRTQQLYNTGFACMIASLAILPFNTWGAVAVFIIGYVVMILSPRTKKS